VPVLVFVRDLALLDADRLATGGAELDVDLFEALAAVGLRGLHEVALSAEELVAVEAGEVCHVPGATLGLGALVAEDDLVAGRAAGLEELGVVTAAVDLGVVEVVEVDEVDEELVAGVAEEAGRVPAGLRTCARCKYPDGAVLDGLFALLDTKNNFNIFYGFLYSNVNEDKNL